MPRKASGPAHKPVPNILLERTAASHAKAAVVAHATIRQYYGIVDSIIGLKRNRKAGKFSESDKERLLKLQEYERTMKIALKQGMKFDAAKEYVKQNIKRKFKRSFTDALRDYDSLQAKKRGQNVPTKKEREKSTKLLKKIIGLRYKARRFPSLLK